MFSGFKPLQLFRHNRCKASDQVRTPSGCRFESCPPRLLSLPLAPTDWVMLTKTVSYVSLLDKGKPLGSYRSDRRPELTA